MFNHAYGIAQAFTRPVVLSRLTASGKCSAGMGSYVVVNNEGWILTACHILEQLQQAIDQEKAESLRAAKEEEIRTTVLDRRERQKRLNALGKTPENGTARASAWWGKDGLQLVNAWGIQDVDLAVGRLQPFDPAWVPRYPTFKDPTKNFGPGTSLCKLGYPFHSIEPKWHDDKSAFELPPGSIPPPLFPIDGIFTREVHLGESDFQGRKIDMRWLETSTPGLRGQSGGPTFDNKGSVWAIQCRTQHYALGFNPQINEGAKVVSEHQFLNVGLGVHPVTFLSILEELKIKHELSDY